MHMSDDATVPETAPPPEGGVTWSDYLHRLAADAAQLADRLAAEPEPWSVALKDDLTAVALRFADVGATLAKASRYDPAPPETVATTAAVELADLDALIQILGRLRRHLAAAAAKPTGGWMPADPQDLFRLQAHTLVFT